MEKTKFIVGELSGNYLGGMLYYWRIETEYEPSVGDFAIVENRDTFAMVEILAIGETTREKEKVITGHSGGIGKKVKYILPRDFLMEKK